MSRDHFTDIFDDAFWEMIPSNKANGPSEGQESTWGYRTFQQDFVPGKNIAIDESTVGFKRIIIFETYNPKKPMK
jgi:hypothetical protein